MKTLLSFLSIIFLLVSLPAFSQGGGGVKNGDTAPDFTVKDQNGKTVSLGQFKGKKLVLYFYPKDDTPGCTKEACSLRDNYDSLTRAGYTILGVSSDDVQSHKNFETKYNLPFTLLADVDRRMATDYKVLVDAEKDGKKYQRVQRTTFIIDQNGKVVHVMTGDEINTQEHAHQVLLFKAE